MDALGSVSQIYMFVLLALLFVGSGLAVWSFIHFLADKAKKPESMKKENRVISNNGPALESGSDKKIFGGFKMANNGWLKLAVFSLVGILISVFALGFVTTSSADAMSNMNMTGNSMTSSSTHSQHQQQGMNAQMQGNMGNMQMQGNMNGNMGAQMQGNMNGMSGYQGGNDYLMMQNQLSQMQMQLNQMQQQQMYNMNNNMQMQSGGNNMQSSGMNNMQSGGMGMGMMNMGGMNNMQQQGNMSQNSSGGMSMM